MLEEDPKIKEAKVIILRSGKELKGREKSVKKNKKNKKPSNVKQ